MIWMELIFGKWFRKEFRQKNQKIDPFYYLYHPFVRLTTVTHYLFCLIPLSREHNWNIQRRNLRLCCLLPACPRLHVFAKPLWKLIAYFLPPCTPITPKTKNKNKTKQNNRNLWSPLMEQLQTHHNQRRIIPWWCKRLFLAKRIPVIHRWYPFMRRDPFRRKHRRL